MICTVIETVDGERFTRVFPSIGHYMDWLVKHWEGIQRVEMRKEDGANG